MITENRTIDIRTLSRYDLSEILDEALVIASSGRDWNEAFPKIYGYRYFIPQGHDDLEEYPKSFRGHDHAIAHETAKHPSLYPKIEKLISVIILRNWVQAPFMSNVYEFAGTHYAVELVLQEKAYMPLYTDFLISNNRDDERFQCYDFVRIVRKWDWIYETYYLLFARFFSARKSFDDDLDYLNYNVSSLKEGRLEEDDEKNEFFRAIKDFLLKLGFDPSDHNDNLLIVDLFGKMVQKHIFPRDPEKVDEFKQRYHEVIEKLHDEENSNPDEPQNEYEEEDIAVLGPENWEPGDNSNEVTGITQPEWSWDDEDIPEI